MRFSLNEADYTPPALTHKMMKITRPFDEHYRRRGEVSSAAALRQKASANQGSADVL